MVAYDNHFRDSNTEHTGYSITPRDMRYPYGKPNIVFVEMFAYSTGDIQRDASLVSLGDFYLWEDDDTYKSDSLGTASDCRLADRALVFDKYPTIGPDGIEMLSTAWTDSKSADEAFVRFVLLKLPDNTLIGVRLSVTREEQMYMDRLENVVNSISLGEKPLNLSRHVATISHGGIYETVCPKNYIMTYTVGEWSAFYTFRKMSVIGQPTHSIDIYTHYGLPGIADEYEPPLQRELDQALGLDFEWRYIDPVPDDPGRFRRAYGYIDTGLPGEISRETAGIHIKAYCADQDEWETIKQIVRDLSKTQANGNI